MKAWMSGETLGVGALALTNADVPAPAANELLVKVSHAALNFSDLLMMDDKYQVRPPRPFIPGQEISGVVVTAPPLNSSFKPGDRIASKVNWGGFAEYTCTRADMAIPVPSGVSLAHAIALPVSYVTALVALDHCTSVSPGETVVVHAAAGGFGLAAVEIAVARGAKVIATASSCERLAIASEHGAQHGVNYSDENWFRQVKELTEGRGANIIVDPVGGRIGEDSLRCIAVDGTYLIVGFAAGPMPKLAAHRLLLKRASAKGVYWNHDTDPDMLKQVTADLTSLMGAGQLNPRVNADYGFDDLPRALDDLASRRVTGKIALSVDSEGAAE